MKIEKSELREVAKQRRESIAQKNSAEELTANFLKNIKLEKNSVIASYSPTHSEIDVMVLNRKLIELGHIICLPIIKGDILEFHEWNETEQLIEGKFGIKTPNPKSQILNPNYIIVPLLAFDSEKNRLGYGGGYYDRTLPRHNACKVGVAFEEQRFAEIPSEETDIKLDYIVTDKNFY